MKKLAVVISTVLMMSLVLGACVAGAPGVTENQMTAIAETVTAAGLQETALPSTPSLTPEMTETQTATHIPQPTATPESVNQAVGPDNFPPDVNPLTGLVVADTTLLDRLPVAVKVPNFPAYGRPHGGLSAADIVWETFIGGGSNRFMPIYYGQDSNYVWPVRSVRIVDPEIASLYQSVLVFSGGDGEKVMPKVYSIMGNRVLAEGSCPGICDTGSGDVTRLYADTAAITDIFQANGVDDGSRPNLDGMRFDPTPPTGGEAGSKATLFYNYYDKGDWVYDEESGKYLRWIEHETTYEMIPLVDRLTDAQLAFSNVIMLYAYHNPLETALIDIGIWDNTTGERAVIFRDGRAYDVSWKTTDRSKPLQFFNPDGSIFALKPGNTWVGVMGVTSVLEITGGEWLFTFSMP